MNRSSGNAVDSKTVELRFDNQQFEAGAKQSLSTIERLKNVLNGNFVGKGVHGIAEAANASKKAVDGMNESGSKISSAFDTIKTVAGIKMIADAAGEVEKKVVNMIKSMSTDQITAGWTKYAQKTEAVQTIMSATREQYESQEAALEDINAQLEKLNWFSDETSANFTDMVDNIGKFTANQVALDKAAVAMEGVFNWASTAGQTATEAGRAMYNLSQAIGVGSVKLIDWKSIQNANMATAEFKKMVIETAEELGTLTKTAEGTWQTVGKGSEVSVRNFESALSEGWFSSEVLVDVLNKYGVFTEKLYEYMDEMDYDSATDVLQAIDKLADGTINWAEETDKAGVSASRLKEILQDLGSEELEFSRNAFRMAQQAITFKQAMEATEDAASTAWMNIFESIFGDYLTAKGTWTKLSEMLYDVFVNPINDAGEAIEEGFGASNIATVEDFNKVVDAGLANPKYIANLRKAGEESGFFMDRFTSDMEYVQTALRNGMLSTRDLTEAFEALGESTGLTAENVDEDLKKRLEEGGEDIQAFLEKIKELDKDASAEDIMSIIFGNGAYDNENKELEATLDGLLKTLGLTQEQGDVLRDTLIDMGLLTGDATKAINEMSMAELRAAGYTLEEAAAIRSWSRQGKDAVEIFKLLGVDAQTGADHWSKGLNNLMDAVIAFKDVAGKEWSEVFPDVEGDQIFDILKAFDAGTKSLVDYIENSETLRSVINTVAEAVSLVVQNWRLFVSGLGGIALTKGAGLLLKLVGGFAKLTGTLLKAATIFEFVRGFFEGFVTNADGTTNAIGDIVNGFIKFLKVLDPINKLLGLVRNLGRTAGLAFGGFINKVIKSEKAQKAIAGLKKNWDAFYTGFSKHMNDGKGRVEKFMMNLDRMGGLRLDNFGEVFKMAKDELVDWLMTFPGVKEGIENLKKIWSSFEDALRDAGIPVDDIKESFSTLGSSISTAFGWIKDMALDAWSFLQDKWKTFINLPVVQENIQRFKDAFGTVKETFGPWIDRIKAGWDSFVQKVDDLGGFKFENLGKIWDAFSEDVLSQITSWEGFTAIKDAFSNLWTDIKQGIKDTTGFDIDGAWAGVKSFFEELRGILKEIGLPSSLKEIPGFIEKVGDAINNMKTDKSGTAAQVFGALRTVFEAVYNVIKYVVDHWKIFAAIGLVLIFLKKLDMIVADVRARFQATTRNINATAKLKTAAAFAVVVVALILLLNEFIKLAAAFNSYEQGAWAAIEPALFAMVTIMGMMAVVFFIVGKFKVKASEITGVALVVASFWVLAQAFKSLGKMELNDLRKAEEAFAIVGLVLIAMMLVMGLVNKFGGKDAGKNVGKAFKGIAYAIAAIAAALLVMALIPTEKLKIVVNHLEILLAVMGVVMLLAGLSNVSAAPFIAMAGVIAVIGLAIGLLAKLVGVEKVEAIAESLIKVLLSLAALEVVVALVGNNLKATEILKGLVPMIVALAAVGAALWLLSEFSDADKLATIADAISKVMLPLAALTAVVGLVGKFTNIKDVGEGLAAAIGSLAIIAAAITGLGYLGTNVEGFSDWINNGLPLFEKVVDGIAHLITTIMNAIGEAIFGDLTPLERFASDVEYIVTTFGSESFKESLRGLADLEAIFGEVGTGLGAAAGWGIIFSVDGGLAGIASLITGAASWVTGEDDIMTSAEMVVHEIDAITALGDPELRYKLLKLQGLDEIFGEIGTGLGAAVGWSAIFSAGGAFSGLCSIVAGAATWLTTGDAMTATETVINDIKTIADGLGDPELQQKLINIKNLDNTFGEIGGILAAAEGWSAIFSAGGAFSGICTIVAEAGDWISGNDNGKTAVEHVIGDIKAIADGLSDPDLQEKLNKIGALDMTTISSNLEDISDIDKVFNETGYLSSFLDIFTSFNTWMTGEKKNSISKATSDIKALATILGSDEVTDSLTKLGEISIPTEQMQGLIDAVGDASVEGFISSLLDWLTPGEEGAMDEFITNVRKLGTAVRVWTRQMKLIEGESFEVPEEQIGALQRCIDGVAKEGGLLGSIKAFLEGKGDLDSFKTDAQTLGEAVQNFVTGLGEADLDKLTKATEAAANLAKLASNMQGVTATIEASIGPFSRALEDIGRGFNDLLNAIEDPQATIDAANAFTPMIEALTTVKDVKIEGDITDTTKVGEFVAHLNAVKKAIEDLKDMDTSGTYKLKGALTTIGSVDVSGASAAAEKAKDAIASSGKGAADSLADSLGNSASKDKATGAVSGLMDAAAGAIDTARFAQKGTLVAAAITEGLVNGTKYVVTAVTSMMSEASGAISTSEFMTAGNNAADGFASGITLRAYVAVQAAAAMARLAVQAVKNTIQSASPSKVTRELGGFFTEGFAIGVSDRVDNAVRASNSMAAAVTEGLRTTIGTINSMIENGINTDPVIRPVLDLSEIQNGAVGIGELLSEATPIGLYDAFGNVMSNVESRRRASSIDDVVSALGAIERSNSNVSGDTYNINGITYDDGSNVADAVRTLVRATKVGRRA